MYTHSLTYTYDNYTNTGIQGTMALNQNVFLQLGVSAGSDTSFLHLNQKTNNPYPNYLYPSSTFATDPGAQPSVTACVRVGWNEGRDNFYPCADAINTGTWGYNNLQWYGFTYYHKVDDHWHVSYEFYDLHQNGVANALNPPQSWCSFRFWWHPALARGMQPGRRVNSVSARRTASSQPESMASPQDSQIVTWRGSCGRGCPNPTLSCADLRASRLLRKWSGRLRIAGEARQP